MTHLEFLGFFICFGSIAMVGGILWLRLLSPIIKEWSEDMEARRSALERRRKR